MLQICNRIFPNLVHIAICNKWLLIALQFICNKPVIYWTMTDESHIIIKEAYIIVYSLVFSPQVSQLDHMELQAKFFSICPSKDGSREML